MESHPSGAERSDAPSERPSSPSPAHSPLGYADAFRILIARWGPARRNLEIPHWVSRDRSCIVVCVSRLMPACGANPPGGSLVSPFPAPHEAATAMVLRCYSDREVPFHFMEARTIAELDVAVRMLDELDLGDFTPTPSPTERSHLRSLGASPSETRAASRAARKDARELRAHSRALLATCAIAAGVHRRQQSRRLAGRPPAPSRCRA